MICFQNLYLWYSDTTYSKLSIRLDRCDLLSKFISLIFWYNKRFPKKSVHVVICFQNLYLWYSDTTRFVSSTPTVVVICFQNLYLWYYWYNWTKRKRINNRLWFAFKIYIFDILIQPEKGQKQIAKVVICFQNLYLWYSDTTSPIFVLPVRLLWFAFKIYIFDILIQHFIKYFQRCCCCDLLSKFISLIFWYNLQQNLRPKIQVVICFQIFIFDILIQLVISNLRTSKVVICFQNFISLIFWYNFSLHRVAVGLLWFAFKIYIFDILIQQTCVIINLKIIVICFQNLYLWYSDTT